MVVKQGVELAGLEGTVAEVQEETGRLLLRVLNLEGVEGDLVEEELANVCKLFQVGGGWLGISRGPVRGGPWERGREEGQARAR